MGLTDVLPTTKPPESPPPPNPQKITISQEKARKGAAAEARRARDARGEEPSPLPSPSGSTLGSAEVAGYDLEAGGVVGEETKAPDGAGPGRRSFGGNDQSDARDYAPGRGMGSIAVNGASGGGGVVGQPQGQGLPSPARFSSARLPPPPRRRWALLFHHAAADGTEAGGGRLVAPIPRRPHRNPPAPALTPLGLPTLVQGVGAAAAAPSSSALPAALSDASPSGSASRSRSGYGSTTRPGARAVGDGDGFGVRRGVTMAVP